MGVEDEPQAAAALEIKCAAGGRLNGFVLRLQCENKIHNSDNNACNIADAINDVTKTHSHHPRGFLLRR